MSTTSLNFDAYSNRVSAIVVIATTLLLATIHARDGLTEPASNQTIANQVLERTLPEPLIPTDGSKQNDSISALKSALETFISRKEPDDFSSIENFLTNHPDSTWSPSLYANLGLLEYQSGYFSRCVSSYKKAWDKGKDAPNHALKPLMDRAGGEYVKMMARLGRREEIAAFLEQTKTHEFIGPATEMVAAAKQGLAVMNESPETAYRCGPLALASILRAQGRIDEAFDAMDTDSNHDGLSLKEVSDLSKRLKMNYRMAKRSPGAVWIMPSVVHWKAGHYAALMEKSGDLYLSRDPTFGDETWHTDRCLEAETSGYFLVPDGELPAGWVPVDDVEGSTIFGKGTTSTSNQDATTDYDHTTGGDDEGGSCHGMARYSFHSMLVSLSIRDTPVGYKPPFGPSAYFTVSYRQRENNQPSTFNYSNLGPKWTHNWLSFIVDNPSNPSVASLVPPGGGIHRFSGYNSSTATFSHQLRTRGLLRRQSTNPISYRLEHPDGSVDIYARSDGSTVSGRRIFLTQRTDPFGNSITLAYDGINRLTGITDASGQTTVISYSSTTSYLISRVTDPFGRSATFTYDSLGRLIRIVDVIGIQSGFDYSGNTDFVNALTTPYGRTVFEKGENGRTRRLTATDPIGGKEVLEFNESSTHMPSSEDASILPSNMYLRNRILYGRNSYYWDKKAWNDAPEDYSKAHVFHWLHAKGNLSVSDHTLESERPPLQGRIWYNYPGQAANNEGATEVGTMTKPSKAGLRLDDGTTRLSQFSYNTLGYPTSIVDPVGRTTQFTYSANGQDLLTVAQVNGGTLATFTYNAQHLPLTHRDAAGRTTSFTWNNRGQLLTQTDPLGRVTAYTYFTADASGRQRKGRLEKIDGPLTGTSDTTSFDYDSVGRVSSVTGPDGYALAFTYDTLDRLVRVTFPDSSFTQSTYSNLSLVSRRDRRGRLTQYRYNGIRELIEVTDPANRITRFAWCKCGDLRQLIDPRGGTTRWVHDVAGRVTSKVYADGSAINYGYEARSGRLQAVNDPSGQIKRFTYALDGQVSRIAYENEKIATADVSFTYDSVLGRLLTMVDGTGTTTFAYHALNGATLGGGQLASVDGPLASDTVAYSYDALGRRTSYTVNGVGETTSFDALGRVSQLTNPLGTFTPAYVGATNRIASIGYPGGVNTAYSYHPLAGDFRLREILHTRPGGAELSRHSYEYDAEGTMTRWTQVSASAGINRSWRLGHDLADQLVSVSAQDPGTLAARPTGNASYAYDAAGNRTLENRDGILASAAYDGLNRILNAGGTAPAPPLRGFEWDAEDRLIAITYPGTNRRTEFTYDGLGRRIAIIEKAGTTVQEHRRFVWDGLRIVEERGANGQAIRRRYFTGGMQYAATAGGSLQARLFATDHLGSVRHVTNGSGTWLGSVDYDPWGRRTITTGSSDETALGFTGHPWHEASGLALAPYRAYDPVMGRWISRDPIGERDGSNLYQYVQNSPINLVDPDGTFAVNPVTISWFLRGAAAVAGYIAIRLTPPSEHRDRNLLNRCPKSEPAGQCTESGNRFTDGKGFDWNQRPPGGLTSTFHNGTVYEHHLPNGGSWECEYNASGGYQEGGSYNYYSSDKYVNHSIYDFFPHLVWWGPYNGTQTY